MYVVSHTEVTRSLSEPRAFLREAGLQEAYTKACPNSAKELPQHVGAMS